MQAGVTLKHNRNWLKIQNIIINIYVLISYLSSLLFSECCQHCFIFTSWFIQQLFFSFLNFFSQKNCKKCLLSFFRYKVVSCFIYRQSRTQICLKQVFHYQGSVQITFWNSTEKFLFSKPNCSWGWSDAGVLNFDIVAWKLSISDRTEKNWHNTGCTKYPIFINR